MERQSRFDLTATTETWLDTLRQHGTLTDDDLRELQTHLLDAVEPLKAGGLSEEEAFLVARHRLGSAEVVGEEFGKIQRLPDVQREPMLLLLGAFGFLILKNAVDITNVFAVMGFAQIWGDSRLTSLANAGICLALMGALVVLLVRLTRDGREVLGHFLASLHHAPAGVTLGAALLFGASVAGAQVAGREFDGLVRIASTWKQGEIWHVHNLFWLGFYLSWLVAFLNLSVRYASTGRQTLLVWLREAPVGWLILAGLSLFTCTLGLSVAGMRLLVPTEGISRFFICAWISCLLSGLVLARSSRYSMRVRFGVILAPILLWYGLALSENALFDEFPSFLTPDFFALKFVASAVAGALSGLFFGSRQVQEKANA